MALRSSSCSVRNWCRSSSAGELLQRQRVDPAEQGQRPLGGAQPLLLLGPDERRRVRLGPRRDLVRRRRRRRAPAGRAVLRDQRLGLDAELLQRLLLQRLDPQPLLGAGHLVAVHAVGEPLQLARRARAAGRGRRSARRPARPGPPRRARAPRPRGPASAPGGRGRPARPAPPRARRPPRGPGARPAGLRPGPASRSWAAARASWSARPASARTRSSPVRTASRASTSACRAARAASSSWSRSAVSGSVVVRAVRTARRGRGVALLELGERGPVDVQLLGGRARSTASSRSASPRAARAWAPSWPSCSATAAIRASDSCSRSRAACTSRVATACSSGAACRANRGPVDPVPGLAEPGGRPRRPRPAPRAGSARWPTRRPRAPGRAGRPRG